jgi:tripartite-type tricarboxylate transporter receptor subunit TctC
MRSRLLRFLGVTAGFCLLCAATGAIAQSYPSKPSRVIQPTAPGGPSDINARGIAQVLADALGQPFVVENRPGADSIIGNEACARAAPDGYTLCTSSAGAYSLNPLIRAKMPYEPLRDLAPVICTGLIYGVFIAHPSLPASSLNEVFEMLKAKPRSISFATAGLTSVPTLYVAYLKAARGIEFLDVPYKVQTQGATAVLSGETMMTMFGVGQVAPLLKAGKVKALAMNMRIRSPLMPQVPTFEEAGMDINLRNWFGLFVPAGTPREIILRLNAEVNKGLLQNAAMREKFLTAAGLEVEAPAGESPEAYMAFLKGDREYHAKIIKVIGIQPAD